MTGRVVLLAAFVVVVLGTPAPPPGDWDLAGDTAGPWLPAPRGIERERAAALAELFRARGRGSVEGVLGACQTFAALGDREVVSACVRVARGLAGADRVGDRLEALERAVPRRQ